MDSSATPPDPPSRVEVTPELTAEMQRKRLAYEAQRDRWAASIERHGMTVLEPGQTPPAAPAALEIEDKTAARPTRRPTRRRGAKRRTDPLQSAFQFFEE